VTRLEEMLAQVGSRKNEAVEVQKCSKSWQDSWQPGLTGRAVSEAGSQARWCHLDKSRVLRGHMLPHLLQAAHRQQPQPPK
jgi:hypothetical protein